VVVEDVRGGSLEEALEREPRAAVETLDRLAELLATLGPSEGRRSTRPPYNGTVSSGSSCEGLATGGALRDIAERAVWEPRAAAVRDQLADAVRNLAAARPPHTLSYGEFGPDQVRLPADGTGP
jgi:hypothetical protein